MVLRELFRAPIGKYLRRELALIGAMEVEKSRVSI